MRFTCKFRTSVCALLYASTCVYATLIPLIKRECEVGSVIHADKWPAYSSLTAEGFLHDTVYHQHNHVDPTSGAQESVHIGEEKRSAGAPVAESFGPLLLAHETKIGT